MTAALQATDPSNHPLVVVLVVVAVVRIGTATEALPLAAVAGHRQPAAAARHFGRRLALQSWQVPVDPWVVAQRRVPLPAALQ